MAAYGIARTWKVTSVSSKKARTVENGRRHVEDREGRGGVHKGGGGSFVIII